ncbi:unnamed protein product, partial [Amoebophrya sp. A25]|eukprot:GSA25T00001856001.1
MEEEIFFCPPRRIAAGYAHNVSFVTPEEEGQAPGMRAWGRNEHNVLAMSAASCRKAPPVITAPTPIDFFRGLAIFEVSCGQSHTVVLEKKPDRDGGKVWCAGFCGNGRLGVEREELREKVRAAEEETGDSNSPLNLKRQATILPPQEAYLPPSVTIARVSAGADHTLALTEYGQVMAWGAGNYGNLGSGGTHDAWIPTLVHSLEETECVQVAAGAKHSLALTRKGIIYAWGHGGNG